jgi:hypothetical protein
MRQAILLAKAGVPFCSYLERGLPLAIETSGADTAVLERSLLALARLTAATAPAGIDPFWTFAKGNLNLKNALQNEALMQGIIELTDLPAMWFRKARALGLRDDDLRAALPRMVEQAVDLDELRRLLELEVAHTGEKTLERQYYLNEESDVDTMCGSLDSTLAGLANDPEVQVLGYEESPVASYQDEYGVSWYPVKVHVRRLSPAPVSYRCATPFSDRP